MKKSELVAKMAEESGLSKKDSEKALNAFVTSVSEGVQEGGKVTIPGLGNFEKRHRNARKGRNPQTGEEIMIPASNTVVFKQAKRLKDSVN